MPPDLTALDWAALGWFLLAWLGSGQPIRALRTTESIASRMSGMRRA